MSRKYLLDTNALGDLIFKHRGCSRATEVRAAGGRIGTCAPVLGELLFGIEQSATREKNLVAVNRGLSALTMWGYDHDAAAEFGRLQAELRRRGRPMQVIDIQLAAVALALGNCTVVSSDSDLLAMPGLSVENWAT